MCVCKCVRVCVCVRVLCVCVCVCVCVRMLKIRVSAYFNAQCMHEFMGMSVPVYNCIYCTYIPYVCD